MQREYEDMHEKKRTARKNGSLFFVRIYGKNIDPFKIMEILAVSSIESERGKQPYIYVEVSQAPTDAIMEKLMAVKNVKRVHAE
jgi:hypothetical protein